MLNWIQIWGGPDQHFKLIIPRSIFALCAATEATAPKKNLPQWLCLYYVFATSADRNTLSNPLGPSLFIMWVLVSVHTEGEIKSVATCQHCCGVVSMESSIFSLVSRYLPWHITLLFSHFASVKIEILIHSPFLLAYDFPTEDSRLMLIVYIWFCVYCVHKRLTYITGKGHITYTSLTKCIQNKLFFNHIKAILLKTKIIFENISEITIDYTSIGNKFLLSLSCSLVLQTWSSLGIQWGGKDNKVLRSEILIICLCHLMCLVK